MWSIAPKNNWIVPTALRASAARTSSEVILEILCIDSLDRMARSGHDPQDVVMVAWPCSSMDQGLGR